LTDLLTLNRTTEGAKEEEEGDPTWDLPDPLDYYLTGLDLIDRLGLTGLWK